MALGNYSPLDFNFGAGMTPSLGAGMDVMVPNYGAPSQGAGAPAASGAGTLGWNFDTAKLALGGLQTIGSLWQAWEANKLARETFKFQKDFARTNLANSIQSYNTTLEDRGRSRAFTEGQSAAEAQAYLDKNRLPTSTIK